MNRHPGWIDPKIIPQPLIKLSEAIHTIGLSNIQRKVLADLMNKILEDTTKRNHILASIQDSLIQQKLDIAYLIFDIEATRRERDAFQKKLRGY